MSFRVLYKLLFTVFGAESIHFALVVYGVFPGVIGRHAADGVFAHRIGSSSTGDFYSRTGIGFSVYVIYRKDQCQQTGRYGSKKYFI